MQKGSTLQLPEGAESFQRLHFDEKKNSPLTPQKFGVGTHFVREEHITLVAEPGSSYVRHFIPKSGKQKTFLKDSWNSALLMILIWTACNWL